MEQSQKGANQSYLVFIFFGKSFKKCWFFSFEVIMQLPHIHIFIISTLLYIVTIEQFLMHPVSTSGSLYTEHLYQKLHLKGSKIATP